MQQNCYNGELSQDKFHGRIRKIIKDGGGPDEIKTALKDKKSKPELLRFAFQL